MPEIKKGAESDTFLKHYFEAVITFQGIMVLQLPCPAMVLRQG